MGTTSQPNGVLNETTGTVHRQEAVGPGLETVCGVTYNVPKDTLRPTEVATVADLRHTTKCGRCFDEGRGY